MMNEGKYRLRHSNTLSIFFIIIVSCIADLQGAIQVELVNGKYRNEGRVEIIRNGIRGTVCDDIWHSENAAVVCRMVGYTHGGIPYSMAKFGQGIGKIWLDDVNCTGHEITIEACNARPWEKHNCDHSEDAGVHCLSTIVELVNGPSSREGRVEIIHNGIRGTVCDHLWDDADAAVICRMIGYNYGGRSHGGGVYGEGTGVVLLDEVQCTGNESSIEDCTKGRWHSNPCSHSHDAGVHCHVLLSNTTDNIAFQQPTIMSSTSHESHYAVDGSMGTYLLEDHCSQTREHDQTPWWMIDLHGTFLVHSLVITNRGDAFWERLHNFVIEIFAQSPHRCPNSTPEVCVNYTGSALGRGETRTFPCQPTIRGRFLRIRKWKVNAYDDVLTLCEIQIFGSSQTECNFPSFLRTENTRLSSEEVKLITKPTPIECATACVRNTSCLAFNFNVNTKPCELLFNPMFNDTKEIQPDWSYYGSDLC